MYKWLKPESKIAQNGISLAAPWWIVADVLALDDNIPMAASFLGAAGAGFVSGQTKTGAFTQSMFSCAAYCFMGYHGLKHHSYGDVISSVGGLISTSRSMVDNFQGSYYSGLLASQKPDLVTDSNHPKNENVISAGLKTSYDVISQLPKTMIQQAAKAGQTSRNKKIRDFSQDVEAITQRPAFAGATFGATFDLGYLASGVVAGDYTRIASSFTWFIAYGLTAVASPKDGQKNIFAEWYENARDKVKSVFDNKNDNNPGQKPQVA